MTRVQLVSNRKKLVNGMPALRHWKFTGRLARTRMENEAVPPMGTVWPRGCRIMAGGMRTSSTAGLLVTGAMSSVTTTTKVPLSWIWALATVWDVVVAPGMLVKVIAAESYLLH